jgi:isocitrate/isopropylmalate dehydrogenase
MTEMPVGSEFPARPKVSLIEGDGIGPEITRATLRAVEAAGGSIEWEPVRAGPTVRKRARTQAARCPADRAAVGGVVNNAG